MDALKTPQRPMRPVKRMKSPRDGSDSSAGSKVAHTLTACCRCRHRKTRCDTGLPRCDPCERSNSVCEYFDTARRRNIPRTFVIHLQNRVQQLEDQLLQAFEEPDTPLDAETLMRGAGLVRFQDNEESRYLGPSSGIAMTRMVMELAKQNSRTKSIKEIVPEMKAQQIKERSTQESSKPTSKVYPLISSVAAPNLPTRELTQRLVELFNKKAQYLLPVLHEPSFHDAVHDVYQGSQDAYKNFTLRMVIAISMQKLDTQYAGLADSYYLAALPYLENAIRPMNLGTLQCFALMAQYSVVTPTRTASLWVVGLAVKLCVELGITDESTVTCSPAGAPLDTLQVDLRRRLFWIIISFEFGLAHSLGRPSSWAVTHDHINVQFFLPVDDHFISSVGVLPGNSASIKKRIAIHFFKMRLLQAEIRHKLYLQKRSYPKNDQDPWFIQMESKLNNWVASSPRNDEGSGLSETWFKVRNNTMIVFLYRPSPQVPEPTVQAARKCFEAAMFNIHVQREQIHTKSVDLTWIFAQSLFMALNTLLWALSYSEIRKEHPKSEVEDHLHTAHDAILLSSERWPGVESALELYDALIEGCLKAYDGSSEASYVVASPSNRSAARPLSDVTTPPLSSTPSTVHSSLSETNSVPTGNVPPPTSYPVNHNFVTSKQQLTLSSSPVSNPTVDVGLGYCATDNYPDYADFDPSSYTNRLPRPLSYGSEVPLQHPSSQIPFHDQNFYLGSVGEQYAQYIHSSQYTSTEILSSLDLEQQTELMSTLERDGLNSGLPPTPDFLNGLGYMA